MPRSHLLPSKCGSYKEGLGMVWCLPWMWSPTYWVYWHPMPGQFCDWDHWNANIQNHHFILVLHYGSQVIWVHFIPSYTEQWRLILALIDNCRVLKVSEVKVSNWSVLSRRSKHVDILSETYIVNCFVMSYQLSLNYSLLYVPNGACGINTRSSNHIQVLLVPIKASKRRAIVRLLKIWCLA